MGIKGLHQVIKKKKVKFKQFNSLESFVAAQNGKPVYFDLLGCLFHIIKKMLYEKKKEKLLFSLIQLLHVKNLIVVVDGSRSKEKMDTTLKRLSSIQSNLSKFNDHLEKAKSLEKLSKNHWKRLEKYRLASYQISKVDLDYIVNGLIMAGVTVEKVPFEADVWIAKQIKSVVISKDGDYYCHKNVEVEIILIVDLW